MLPQHLGRVRTTLATGDLTGLAEGAHKLYGTLAAFSTVAATLASTFEDAANQNDADRCVELVMELDAISAELLEDMRGLTLSDLGP